MAAQVLLLILLALLSTGIASEARFYAMSAGDGFAVWLWRATGLVLAMSMPLLGWTLANIPAVSVPVALRVAAGALGATGAGFLLNVLSFREVPATAEYVAKAGSSAVMALGVIVALASLVVAAVQASRRATSIHQSN